MPWIILLQIFGQNIVTGPCPAAMEGWEIEVSAGHTAATKESGSYY